MVLCCLYKSGFCNKQHPIFWNWTSILSDEITSYHGNMSSTVKLHDVVRCFDGEGDVSVWLRKFRLVTSLRKMSDLHEVLPLFLENKAFAVYEQLKDEDKAAFEKIEQALLDAFAASPFRAYAEFKTLTCGDGESADVFLTELRRLAVLARIADEKLIRCAFVTGMPPMVSAQLQATPKILDMPLDDVVIITRALLTQHADASLGAAAAVPPAIGTRTLSTRPSGGAARRPPSCSKCGGAHLWKWCNLTQCFQCNEMGHTSRHCQTPRNQPSAENGSGKL